MESPYLAEESQPSKELGTLWFALFDIVDHFAEIRYVNVYWSVEYMSEMCLEAKCSLHWLLPLALRYGI